jgi:hypothetical protein
MTRRAQKDPSDDSDNHPRAAPHGHDQSQPDPFRVELGEDEIGDPVLTFIDVRKPTARNPRERAALIYTLAAGLERQSNVVRGRWAVSVNVRDGRIVIEADAGAELRGAWELATGVLADFGFR